MNERISEAASPFHYFTVKAVDAAWLAMAGKGAARFQPPIQTNPRSATFSARRTEERGAPRGGWVGGWKHLRLRSGHPRAPPLHAIAFRAGPICFALCHAQSQFDKKISLSLDSLFSLAIFRQFPSSPHLLENVFSLSSPADCGA